MSIKPPLRHIAPKPKEHISLFFIFHTFSYRSHGEARTEADHRSHNLTALTLAYHGFYEAMVDLDSVKRKFPQVREAGVTGTEIIQG